MFTGPASMFIFCQSKTMQAGVYMSKSDISKHSSSATFIFFSLFFCFHVWVKVNSLAFVMRNFRPYPSKFVSHVTAAVQLKQQSPSRKKKKKQCREKKKQILYMKKRKETENGMTPGSEQPVVKSICGSLMMRWRAASAIIVRCWIYNLQFKLEGIKDHERPTLHEHCIKISQAKKDPS